MKLRNRAIAFIVTIAMVLNNILSPASVWYGDQHALAAESRDATSSSASGQTTGNGGASNASNSSSGTAAPSSQSAAPLVLKKSVTAGKEPAPGEPDTRRTYAVQVTCDASAGVPEGAVLEVSEIEAKDEQKKAAREQLKLAENDRVVAETYIRVVIKDGDSVIQPATPVDVVVETASMAPTYSDAVEAVVLGETDTAVTVENLTGRRDDGTEDEKPATTKLRLKTDKLGDLALATVVTPFDTRSYDGQTIALLGPRAKHTTVDEVLYDDYEVDGKTLLRTVTFRTEPEHTWHPTLWVESRLESHDLASGTVGCWRWQDGHATTKVFGGTGTSSPVAIASDGEFAFMLERMQTQTQTTEIGNLPDAELNLDGETPTETTSAPSAATPEAATPTAAEGSKQAQPVINDQPDEAAARKQAQDQARAEAEQVAAVRSLKKVYTASDGKTYRVTVGNDDTTFDANVELDVREVAEGSVEYLDYVAKAGKELGAPPSNVAYAKALDITLRNTVTGKESHPSENVRVLIELLDADFKPSDQVGVVHFGERPETMNAVVAGNTVSFQTNSFSVYTILATATAPKLTVKNVGVMSTSEGALAKEFLSLDGSWARWKVTVNPNAEQLNSNASLILEDTFDDGVATDARQSIDYSSINVESSDPVNPVTYDYSGNTGTFIIPDGTTVTITYRTRIAAQAGEKKTFHGTARLKLGSAGEPIATATAGTADDGIVVYPSASDVAGFGTNYMIKVFAYANGNMQTGLEGTKFILMDASKRPLEYKVGDNAGQPVTFTTDSNGYVNVQLDEEPGDVAIEKNTGYYLEMIKAPKGYQKDNTLYSFMITDDPSYESGGFYKYYNGDTMKVRLYDAKSGLKVSIRFSGSYNLTDSQKNNVIAILQQFDGTDQTGTDKWTEVERHAYTDTNAQSSIEFKADLSPGKRYRVVQENEKPWDLPDDIYLSTSYYCVKNDEESDKLTSTEFGVATSTDSVTFVIDNRYEEPQLTITKMNKSTGEHLPGAVFQVFKIQNGKKIGDAVKEYTTDAEGKLVIRGGDPYESETLYGVVETTAPEHYLLPLVEDWHYFYFCNDEYLEPTILANLPAGATATNLTNSGDSISLDNQLEKVTIPVMKLWQGNEWPDDITTVEVGLYQSVDGGKPQPVKEGETPRTVELTSTNPYNNTAFTNLPSRYDETHNITYSIKEESINGLDPLKAGYVQDYGVSDAGVYVVRNKPRTTLTVSKKWFNGDSEVDASMLVQQPTVHFDVYRTTTKLPDNVLDYDITNDVMMNAVGSMTKVRENQMLGSGDGWTKTIENLDQKDDLGNLYYYYILETVPSFGDELYRVDGTTGAITIKNQVKTQTQQLTVTKAKLVDDPRQESVNREFEFTLSLQKDDTHPIRLWQVHAADDNYSEGLVTDWDGKVTFKLKPEHSIELTLPVDVTATVTETANSQYTVKTNSSVSGSTADEGRTFSYEVASNIGNATLTYVNTLHVICKVIRNDGTQEPVAFESLGSALKYLRDNASSFTSPWKIYMLEDYTIPETDVVNITQNETLILTTASPSDPQFPFKSGEETDRAVITRGDDGGSMLTNAGTLTLENICLDGAKGSYTTEADGGLVKSSGTLNLNDRATLRNSETSGKGGAVYAEGMMTIANGATITGNAAPTASALYINGELTMTGGTINDNTGAVDGAVVIDNATSKVFLSGTPVIIDNTNTQGTNAANLYIGVDSDQAVSVVSPGLSEGAQIGVSATGDHKEIGQSFARTEYGRTANLNSFVNDAYGYRGKLKDGTLDSVVWDGLKLQINKLVDSVGANTNDTFTITLTSLLIKKSTYTIDGSLDYVVTPARAGVPGSIKFNNVKANDLISISPMPVGDYTISEKASNYTPSYALSKEGESVPTTLETGEFYAEANSTITVTNTRRLADVDLTKKLTDRLVGEDSVDFVYTAKLVETDGTAVKDFTLYKDEDSSKSITTNSNGEATFTMSPTTEADAVRKFKAPVGARMTISETKNDLYRVEVSGRTKTTNGATDIEDLNTNEKDFAFVVSDAGADITFSNTRKMGTIELRKTLVGRVLETEPFNLRVTLMRGGSPVANYTMYEDEDHPENNITTDDYGQAVVHFEFDDNRNLTKSLETVIPEGVKLTVAEVFPEGVNPEIYETTHVVDEGQALSGKSVEIASVSESNSLIAFTNTRRMQTITVSNTVTGYSGNAVPFTYTATVKDGSGYNDNGFENGVQTFELTTGQHKTLLVPYGTTLNVAQHFIVGYETKVNNVIKSPAVDEAIVTDDRAIVFNNNQLINLVIQNDTPVDLTGVSVKVSTSNIMYRVTYDDEGNPNGQVPVPLSSRTATVDVTSQQKKAILEVTYNKDQTYTVSGNTPAAGYYYTIRNESSYHEDGNPTITRIYNKGSFNFTGNLKYGPADSTVTFTSQPLASFDANGGAWTTEMEGYHDRDGDGQVYQMAVTAGQAVSRPQPDPVYPTGGEVEFLGWTTDEEYAKQDHSTDTSIAEGKAYDFATPVNGPVTIYAVWKKDNDLSKHTVTIRNATADSLTVKMDITEGGSTTTTTHVLAAGTSENLSVPTDAKVVASTAQDVLAVSSEFADGDTSDTSFTINAVKRDGTVTFSLGICKITDAEGNTLYDGNGNPAVYKTLSVAFTAYVGTLYTSADKTTTATPAYVKMLVDKYEVGAKTVFPASAMTFTTAAKDDQSFPYVGTRDRSTIYRKTGYLTDCLFEHKAANVTLANIILDGGSERGVKVNNGKNAALINVTQDGATLNINEGTTLRNVEYTAYSSNANGGAIYATNGTLNVSAGLFSNLHARSGGAINVQGIAALNLSGTDGSVVFEDCAASKGDGGGAVYHDSSKSLTINGGETSGYRLNESGERLPSKPGIVFNRCKADDGGQGGAIYVKNVATIISGCEFNECTSQLTADARRAGGGGIAAHDIPALTVKYCSFNACDSGSTKKGGSGGGVVAIMKDNMTATIDHCAFDLCNGKGQGGSLAVYPNSETTATTNKLVVNDSIFTNSSSGTGNGSGGAIQTYTTYVELHGSVFENCLAAKEGGAMNHVYGGTTKDSYYFASGLIVDNCRFVNCRAEDRYEPTADTHYGGGICTRATVVEVSDSYFENCVSTLKEGGALYANGRMTDTSGEDRRQSKTTISNTTFKDCMAKTYGGAVLTAANILEITNGTNFINCKAFGEDGQSYGDGGAVAHRQGRGGGEPQTTTLNGVSFTDCSAARYGGAVWTRGKTAQITGCTITGCTASDSGGAIYLRKEGTPNTSTGTIKGGTITNCTAPKGSAVYIEDKATFSGASITGNTCTDVNSGAVANGTTNGTMYFEGNTVITGNTYSGDGEAHNAVITYNNNTTINTTAVGLGEHAVIGVYVNDPNSAFNNHGKEGQPFGTFNSESSGRGDKYLEAFVNDRIDGLYGYRSITDENDKKIYWGAYICKITDAEGNTLKRDNGKDAVYQRLSLAFGDFVPVKNTSGNAMPVYVKMLVENYSVKQKEQIDNFPAENITLTTETYTGEGSEAAVQGKYDGKHPYRGTSGTVCTISRSNSTNQLFRLNKTDATFCLENITLDGRADKTTTEGKYRLIEAAAGALVINGGTTMQYGKAKNGGAIYASSDNAPVTINGAYDTDKAEATVRFLNCNASDGTNGGAINARKLTITGSETAGEYGTAFVNCTATRGGAICVNGDTMNITGAQCIDCHSATEGGAFYHNNTGDFQTTINNCTFTDCDSGQRTISGKEPNGWSYGGAVTSKAMTLEVKNSTFTNCKALSDGGAINHSDHNSTNGNNNDRTATILVGNVFVGCSTTNKTDKSLSNGGAVYIQTVNAQITECSFESCVSAHDGGAVYAYSKNPNDAKLTISGSSFKDCSDQRSGSNGGAIVNFAKTLDIQDAVGGKNTEISNCTALGRSGAIYMETGGSVLNIKGNTKINDCYANEGGAIYLKENVVMNLLDSPEFTNNGYTTQGGTVVEASKGACIYLAKGSRLNLKDNPKFSRNILPNKQRIVNGGVLDYERQDIYIAGYAGIEATSIYVVGDLGGSSIWVYPEQSPHRLPGEQFAKIGDGVNVRADTLSTLRNALSDEATGCSHGEYLAGVRLGDNVQNVYWSKMYTVSFMKFDNKSIPVPDAEFTLYSDDQCSQVVAIKSSAAEEDDKGKVAFTSVPIGCYYMKETLTPTSYKTNEATYLVLVGSPYLSPTDVSAALWEDSGPLSAPEAPELVARHTTGAGKYYGIFPLDENNKAILRANLASDGVGIVNIRNDYQVSFMKKDDNNSPLPGAAFTIYAPILDADGKPTTFDDGYPQLMRWTRDGENYPDPVVSADGTTDKDINDNTLAKGTVYFRELPEGTYYLLETEYPERNGDNRRTYYEESDRVFRLEVKAIEHEPGQAEVTLSEWSPTSGDKTRYVNLPNNVVTNQEVVCKLTDGSNNLLYSKGHEIWDINGKGEMIPAARLFPAVYPTIEAGFDSAQKGSFTYSDGSEAKDDNLNSLKLQVLKDFTLTKPITYNASDRALTFTTASTTATKDRYVFSTTRTRDTARAEIKRGYSYSELNDTGALVTVDNNASLSLTNIKLNGMKSYYTGRAVRVANGTLNIIDNTLMQDFRAQAAASDLSVRGGAVLMESGTTLNVDGGSNRSAVFSGNSATGTAEGGAIALGDNCTVGISNAQFTGNSASSSGGAISVGRNSLAITNGVFTSNSAPTGGAIHVGANGALGLTNGRVTSNTASIGAAIYGGEAASLTLTGGSVTGNAATHSDGGAINLATTAKIYLGGSPTIYDNTDGSSQQRNVVLSVDSNGVINTTDAGLTGGKIGVYVSGDTNDDLFKAHGKASMPFGTFGDASSKQYADVFKNDRIAELYGTWNQDDPSDNFIYWIGAAGVDFTFTKIDSYGAPLNGAVFTLYDANDSGSDILKDVAGNEVAVENAVATSRTVTKNEPVTVSVVQSDGTVAQKQVWGDGLVSFETIPAGTYFVKETTFPKVDPNNTYDDAPRYRAIETNYKYKVVLGEEGVVAMSVEDGTDGAGNIRWSAVPTSPVQTTTDDVTVNLHTTLNVHPNERRVILRKVSEDDNTFTSLGGAKFRVYRADWSQIRDEEYESDGQSGVYFIDTLPYGVYYLVETQFPNGYAPDDFAYDINDPSTWYYYKLTVGPEGYEFVRVTDNVTQTLDSRGTYVEGLFKRGG